MAPAGKSKKRSSKATEEYESDGGFVANESDAPKSKKAKFDVKAKAKGAGAGSKEQSPSWELTGKRRVTIDTFNGKTMINIREYYEDKNSGEMMPGKKGIALLVPQFSALVSALPELEATLKAKGEQLSRPDYGSSKKQAGDKEEASDDEEVDENGKDTDEGKGKQNFEATSDEEE